MTHPYRNRNESSFLTKNFLGALKSRSYLEADPCHSSFNRFETKTNASKTRLTKAQGRTRLQWIAMRPCLISERCMRLRPFSSWKARLTKAQERTRLQYDPWKPLFQSYKRRDTSPCRRRRRHTSQNTSSCLPKSRSLFVRGSIRKSSDYWVHQREKGGSGRQPMVRKCFHQTLTKKNPHKKNHQNSTK